MTSQELVGRAMRANAPLDLPTKHKVAKGETFRYLQAHLDKGAMAHMWVTGGIVTLLDEDATIPFPVEPVGPAGRRRGRAQGAAVPEAPEDTGAAPNAADGSTEAADTDGQDADDSAGEGE